MRNVFILLIFAATIAACGEKPLEAPPPLIPSEAGPPAAPKDASIEALKRAFPENHAPGAPPDGTLESVQAMFDDVTVYSQAHDAPGVLRNLDYEYLRAASELQGMKTGNTPAERAQFMKNLDLSTRRHMFRAGGSAFKWITAKVMRVEASVEAGFVVAYVRHEQQEGYSDNVRWWLVHTEERWKIYDWEYLNTGIRNSRLYGALSDATRIPAWAGSVEYIVVAQLKVRLADYDGALKDLDRAIHEKMPPDFEAYRLYLVGLVRIGQDREAESLEHFDAALKLNPGFMEARRLRARALSLLMRFDEALPILQNYSSTLGGDGDAMLQLGDCLAWLGRVDEAVKCYREALDVAPSAEGLARLGRYVPPAKLTELPKHFHRMPNHIEAFRHLTTAWYEDEFNPAALYEICQAFHKYLPDSPMLGYYTGRMQLDLNLPGEAAETLRPVLGKVNGEPLVKYREGYWEAMYRSGQALAALGEAKGSVLDTCFDCLAGMYVSANDGPGLTSLCEAREKLGKSPTLNYYRALVDGMAGDWKAAEKRHRDTLAVSRERDWYYPYIRQGLWRAMAKQGRALDAYKEFTPGAEVFSCVAPLLFEDGKLEELDELIKAHEPKTRTDRWLWRARGDSAWLSEDWSGAITEYEHYLLPGYATDPGYEAVAERAVRAALRAGKGKAGEAIARTAFMRENTWLMIIAAAGGKNFAGAEAAIIKYVKHTSPATAKLVLALLYEDEDVGENLKASEYARLHRIIPLDGDHRPH